MATRPLSVISDEIKADWKRPYFGAVPYLSAMGELNRITDKYYADDARSLVLYFLSNASEWRGPVAKRVKAELKTMLKGAKPWGGTRLFNGRGSHDRGGAGLAACKTTSNSDGRPTARKPAVTASSRSCRPTVWGGPRDSRPIALTIEYTKEDEAEMLKIARLVLRFNPYAMGFELEAIVENMKRTALTIADGGYVATSGWMITMYRDGDGRTRMKASLPAHLFED